MFDKFVIVCLSLSFMAVLVQGQDQVQPGPPDKCFKGDFHLLDHYHKESPSPEEKDFPECTSWQNSSCCTHALAEEVSRFNPGTGLYNFSFDRCGPLSERCAEYYRNVDCFYFCEPMLGYFQVDTGASNQVMNVPLCDYYCDAWFEACKDDSTCVEDWLEDFEYDENLINHCPSNSTCRTYQEVYGSGKNLCNLKWGNGFTYSTNRDNCMVMDFDNRFPNPNFKLTFPRNGSLSVVKLGSTMILGAVLLILLVMLLPSSY